MKHSPAVATMPFAKIPHQPGVFLKYVERSPDVLGYYRHPPTLEALGASVAETRRLSFPRLEMVDILGRQNESYGNDESVRRALGRLAQPDSVAVVTGQQVGLFTGPMLTVFKALTALELSRALCQQGCNCIPVFWMATDDHDLAEVTRLVIPGPEARVLDAREQLFEAREMPPLPVGTIPLPETIGQLLDAYTASFAAFEWGRAVKGQLAAACRPGTTFAGAFARLMAELFRGKGLVLFDPRDARAKQLSAPVIGRALGEAQAMRAGLAERSHALQSSGFAAQVAVLPRSTLVFFEERGERRLLLTEGGAFKLKDTDRLFASDELRDLLEIDPERFSPNALLRPLVQDHLFPTVAYVGGPAEVSYFAQVEPLYHFCHRPMPVIWPRQSFTILDPEIRTVMERYSLELQDCFLGATGIVRKILHAQPAQFEVQLSRLRALVDRATGKLRPSMAAADASLGPAMDTARRKILHRAGSLQNRFVNCEMHQNPVLRSDVREVLSRCLPNGHLQEREIGVYPLLARLGPGLLDVLSASLEIADFRHRILRL
jgi:bacillithiol synthase